MVALVWYTFPLARHVAADVLVPLVVDNGLRDWVKNVPLVFFFDWEIVVADVAVVAVCTTARTAGILVLVFIPVDSIHASSLYCIHIV